MRVLRLFAFVGIILLLIFFGTRLRRVNSSAVNPVAAASAQPANTAARRASQADAAEARRETLARLAYAQAWDGAQLPALAAFREWAERYRAAAPAARGALEAEGLALAQARRPAMKELIMRQPERALAVTVPAVVRQILPTAVRAELEARVAGRGDFMLLETTSTDDPATRTPGVSRRVAVIDGASFTAHAYGRREAQLTKEGASLHGIALDGELALHESPLRVLEPGEVTAAEAETHCPVSQLAVAPLPAGRGVNLASLDVVAANGRVWEFCGTDSMLENFEQRLDAAEDRPGPQVAREALGVTTGVTVSPPIAADAPNAHTVGTQRVLVVRVDFSDFPGEPVSLAAAQDMMDSNVRPFLENSSYGATTVATTVSSSVYRMPQTGRAYALAGADSQLHTDARNAASVDNPLSNFDRIIVVFPNIGSTKVTGSLITFGGEGSVGGSSVWINGTFSFRILSHELGHTYGLKHANLWQVNDGNPVSAVGGSSEYKDPFDAMGDSSTADSRFHYNQWSKNRLGWLPDSAVTTVTTSGTYRVYRFDDRNVSTSRTLALRVFRDGVRWYWIGLRQNFSSNASLTGGAYVVWGTNNLQQTQLLDMTTPGSSSTDAALAVGATFTDSVYGVTIKPVGRGGTDPELWLDVEITVPAAPPSSVVTAWGREGANFFDGSGLPTVPPPETNVPMTLRGVTAVAGGDTHAMALKTDGTVVVWGNDLQGQTGVPLLPTPLADVVSIAAGGNVCGAVKRDGTVRVWGDASLGQTTVPSGLSDVKQLAIGTSHVVALKNDGTVVAWGVNTSGQTTVPAGLANVVAVAAGATGSVALKSDGTVVGWGSVNFRSVPASLSGVVAISAHGSGSNGGTHVLALKSDGTVVAWGNNANNQSNVPTGLANVVAIAAGGFTSLALKSDGTVVAWGSNTSGQTTVPANVPRSFALGASTRGCFALTGSSLYLTAQPQAQAVAAGGTATFSVSAVSDKALTYQWRKNGVAISGATASTLTISSAGAASAGNYDVVVRDGTNIVTSSAVTLAITVAPGQEVARISNLSILTSLASRTDTFRMGFVVGGDGTSGTKRLVIRAAGPSLGALGVPNTLGDPTVTLFTGATQVGINDDWGGQTAARDAMAAVGAFPYVSATSLDAALVADINGRDNSVVVGSAAGGAPSGTVISEIYDATPSATFTAAVPRLINVSVLKDIGASLTAGFVIAGPAGATKKVLIRAVGPGLAVVGVTSGFVADPKLTLFGTNQAIVGTNDNWGGTAELKAAFNTVGAFVVPDASKDAAVIATLSPGVNYSAVVTGVGGATGLVLVEVYEMP